MDKSNDYIRNKELERFRYLKDMVQSKQEIHSAITVMKNLRKEQCKDVFLPNDIARELGVRMPYTIWSLLAFFKEYLEERPSEVKVRLDTKDLLNEIRSKEAEL